jgi:hypothetical protein
MVVALQTTWQLENMTNSYPVLSCTSWYRARKSTHRSICSEVAEICCFQALTPCAIPISKKVQVLARASLEHLWSTFESLMGRDMSIQDEF